MKQYIGVIVMLIGALLQLFTYFTAQVEQARHRACTCDRRLHRPHRDQ